MFTVLYSVVYYCIMLCTTVSVVYYCIMLCTTYIIISLHCVLCYTLHRWLCFSLSAVDYQRSVGELSPTIVQPLVFVQYDQISSYDVTESYNCSNNIHSDDVTCVSDMATFKATFTLLNAHSYWGRLLRVRFHQCDIDLGSFPAIWLLA